MKLVLVALALLPLSAHADQTITCISKGEKIVITQTRYDESVEHNGFKFSGQDCRRRKWSNQVTYNCKNEDKDRAIQLSFSVNGKDEVTGQGDFMYRIGNSTYANGDSESDGHGIDLNCK